MTELNHQDTEVLESTTNEDRSRRVEVAFSRYCDEMGHSSHPVDQRDAMTHFVADLLHLARRERIPFSAPDLAYAYDHFQNEIDARPVIAAARGVAVAS